jgi:hypothetical protein
VAPAPSEAASTVALAQPPSVGAPPAVALGSLDFSALINPAQAVEEVAPVTIDEGRRPFRPITRVTIDAALPPGVLPGQPGTEIAGPPPAPPLEFVDPRLWGGWAETDFQWSSTALCHRPLYFEQVNVERYGYTVSPLLQPAISGAHFFLTIPALPYKLVAQPPRECVYTLGYYRAGSPAPRRWHHAPWDPTALTAEGLVATGLVFLIP